MATKTAKHTPHDHDKYFRLCLARLSGSSDGRHVEPTNRTSTNDIIDCLNRNRGSHNIHLNNFFAPEQHTPNAPIFTSPQLSVKSAYITINFLRDNNFKHKNRHKTPPCKKNATRGVSEYLKKNENQTPSSETKNYNISIFQ